MYIFVLGFAPAIVAAAPAAAREGLPFGKVFSCFMASCAVGSPWQPYALVPAFFFAFAGFLAVGVTPVVLAGQARIILAPISAHADARAQWPPAVPRRNLGGTSAQVFEQRLQAQVQGLLEVAMLVAVAVVHGGSAREGPPARQAQRVSSVDDERQRETLHDLNNREPQPSFMYSSLGLQRIFAPTYIHERRGV